MHGSFGGSGQRLVPILVGVGTRRKALKVDLRYHKIEYTGGTMLFRSVPGLATCPRTCCMRRCFGARSGPAVRILNRLSLALQPVGLHASSGASRLLPRAWVFLGKLPPGGEVVVPTAVPIGTQGKAAGLRSRVQCVLGVPACNGRVPALHSRAVPVPVRSCPPDPHMGHPGPVHSKAIPRCLSGNYRSAT